MGSSLPAFLSDGELNPLSNPSLNPGDDGGGLLLLLFSEGRLLLFSKAPNPPNGFAPIVSKCKKCSSSVFLILVALF